MSMTKSILQSRTVWANIVGLGALLAGTLGFDAAGLDQGAMVDAMMKAIAAISFIASTLFRIVATRTIG